MVFKVILFVACVAIAQSAYIPTNNLNLAQASHSNYKAQPIHDQHQSSDYYSAPHYNYQYGVADSHTGDVKTQEESRQGDVVRGSYSLNEADGTRRIVHYTADDHTGFNAVVQREGHAAHPHNYQSNQQNQYNQQSPPSLYNANYERSSQQFNSGYHNNGYNYNQASSYVNPGYTSFAPHRIYAIDNAYNAHNTYRSNYNYNGQYGHNY